jgi:hypothetical protein
MLQNKETSLYVIRWMVLLGVILAWGSVAFAS